MEEIEFVFPQVPWIRQEGTADEHEEWGPPGLSLRDYFAAKALGMFSIGDANHAREIAERAYELADAMLIARKNSE